RSPAVEAAFTDGSRLLDLKYASHTILPAKPPLPGLPSLDGGDGTLEVTLTDRPTGLTVVVSYTVYEDSDVIARHARVVNTTGDIVRVNRALSASVDLPSMDYDLIGLYGAHTRERQVDRRPLRHGMQALESRRGASSHQMNPFLALAAPNADETAGEVYAAALIYSGNFLAAAEADGFNTTRMQIGLNPFDFSWKLEPGESFVTPEAVLTYSAGGLGRMSRNFHRVFRGHLGRVKETARPNPIVINNWEATYFDFDEEKLCALIRSCRGLGIDTFVLDDGWFGRRDDDTTSLGDWYVHRGKLPNGLKPVIDCCRENGMKFGLWFEPEMVSEDSDLYRAHPDWAIKKEGRPFCRGRNQLVLDLSRPEVTAYLKETIGRLLSENDIAYVKWDMNRHLTDLYSAGLPADRQPELPHRYMLGLYDLLGDLTARFPRVLFEGCSGGGGRFDAGMLYYMPQTWTSDNSDAIERLKIQYGTSMVYPPRCMTAHVSAVPNHQIGRVTPFHTRGLVAMSASFGYELNPLSLSEEERAAVAEQTAFYRSVSGLIAQGDFYRLVSPFAAGANGEGEGAAWMFVSPDRSRAFAVYVLRLTVPAGPARRMKLQGLDPGAVYHIDELDADFGGDELMYAGLAMPYSMKDFEALSFTLTRKV
nr:alpha-galactosidase [Bacillota bacterium]